MSEVVQALRQANVSVSAGDVDEGKRRYVVRTEGEFDAALQQAWDDRDAPSIIQAFISQEDHSRTLRRLAERMSHTV